MSEEPPAAEGITLLEGETVLHNLRPSWSKWSTSLLVCTLVTVFTFGIGVVSFAIPWLQRQNSRYVVTDERVIEKHGLLGTTTNEYRIEDIRQLQTGATWSEKMLSNGNIEFSTGAGGELITFEGVPDYQSVANSIREQQRES